ncbi:MAG: hypothetical protein ACKV1O_15420 [Saprospiraceae bacterium]
MKTLLYSFLIIVAIGSFSGCFVASTAHSFFKAPGFKSDATFKIIAVNTDDVLLGRLENHLLKEGFSLISDNYIRGAIPAGSTTVNTRDTTYQVPNHEMMAIRFTDDKPADYVIKYQYSSIFGNRINFLNINVVNVKSGKTEVSFSFPEKANNRTKVINVDTAFALFVAGLRA